MPDFSFFITLCALECGDGGGVQYGSSGTGPEEEDGMDGWMDGR